VIDMGFPEVIAARPIDSLAHKKIRWLKLGLAVAVFVVVGVGLGYLIERLLGNYQLSLNIAAWEAYLIIFGILTVINVSLLPLPFGVSLILVAAAHWNPVLVALVGSLGASVGESSTYIFGSLGKKAAISNDLPSYMMMKRWIAKYRMWAIAFVSLQPVLPFEIAGFNAGLTKMPVSRFVSAIWIGKFPK